MMIKETLDVDKELNHATLQRHLQVQGTNLKCTFITNDARSLRGSVKNFYDYLILAVQTCVEFE